MVWSVAQGQCEAGAGDLQGPVAENGRDSCLYTSGAL